MPDNGDVVRRFLNAVAEGDSDTALTQLHPDIEWRNTGLPTLRGKRVRGAIRDMKKRHVGFGVDFHHVAVQGDVVLTDRTDYLRVSKIGTKFPVRGTFELTDGLIRVWDDAFSWGGFIRGFLPGR